METRKTTREEAEAFRNGWAAAKALRTVKAEPNPLEESGPETDTLHTIRRIGLTDARRNFGALLKAVSEEGKHFIVKQGGVEVVAIIPIADYQELVAVSEQEADRHIARAIRQVRNEEAKKAGLPKPLPYKQHKEPSKRKK